MKGNKGNHFQILILILLLIIVSGCTTLWGKSSDLDVGYRSTETPKPFLPIEIQPSLQAITMTTTSFPFVPSQVGEPSADSSIWITEAVSPMLLSLVEKSGLPITNDKSVATYHLDIKATQNIFKTTTWIYAFVSSFSEITDDISRADLLKAWNGDDSGLIAGDPIWMDSATLFALSMVFGQPASGKIKIASSKELINSVWDSQPVWAIIPFEELQPRWKVMSIDGNSPISNEFDLNNYPLKVDFNFEEIDLPQILNLPVSNRDPAKFTSLVMTGVTALVRATAGKMEKNGVLYPGKDIQNWLVSADLTHISNEIPFSDECPFPDPNQNTLVFCSDKKYIALLEYIGTDIVELTGNHFQDYGSAATYSTLEMYDQEGWIHFGGGANLEDARSPKRIIHNGNKLAFIGCNPAGPQFAWATNYQPGASPCDFGWMHAEISRLVSEGYLPIVTFQYVESYSVYPLPDQVEDFQSMAAAGAVIISGSQAHLPQSMEFFNNSFIHYGLGNLFFDQMDYPVVGTRREFIDRHIFYDGKYISTELLTALLEDYSRPRPMTLEERSNFLQDIFTASGW